jgi:hypothetical protein
MDRGGELRAAEKARSGTGLDGGVLFPEKRQGLRGFTGNRGVSEGPKGLKGNGSQEDESEKFFHIQFKISPGSLPIQRE